ncbi:MAG: SUMF1/EgtB/PvdO family nonheme iron enzyme, partial [Thermodesulfobacteriota bacterium]
MRNRIWKNIKTLAFGFLVFFGGFELKQSFSADRIFKNRLGMEFVRIPEGSFMMGSPVSDPFRSEGEDLHSVMITNSFYLQTTEVTLGQWRAVMGKGWFDPRKGEITMPVTHVSWHDCHRFIKKLNEKGEGF